VPSVVILIEITELAYYCNYNYNNDKYCYLNYQHAAPTYGTQFLPIYIFYTDAIPAFRLRATYKYIKQTFYTIMVINNFEQKIISRVGFNGFHNLIAKQIEFYTFVGLNYGN
jgi:hypothetical protein